MSGLVKYVRKIKKSGILFCVFLLLFTGCSRINSEDDNVNRLIAEYVSEYTVKNENNDGTILIGVVAPDFEFIMEDVAEKDPVMRIDGENIDDIVEKYSEYKKEYVLVVNELSNEEIINALNDKIAEDLIHFAIINSKYEENWGV